MWIHEHKDWHNFTWDASAITSKLTDVHRSHAYLFGKMQALSFELQQEANLNILINDVIETSAIEGEILNSEEVRSSVGRRLGMKQQKDFPKSQDIEGIVEITLDAMQNFSKPLTKERLFGWHAALFPKGRSGMKRITAGKWRRKKDDPMQVVSGPSGKEKIHFEAPEADRLQNEMKDFLQWFNSQDKELDPICKTAIAHLWFVTIHPFDDGNGRIARAICDMAMSRACG